MITAFFVSLLNIGLRAFQQKNVMKDKYLYVMPCSMVMAYCEVYVYHTAAEHGIGGFLPIFIGLGSGMGCMISMKLHEKIK